jgi:Outer membrane protein beta-barrel domain
MFRKLSAAVLSGILVFAPLTTASAQIALSVAGGLSAPVSDLGDVADLGYNIGVGIDFGGTRRPVGARIEGGLNGFGLEGVDESFRIVSGTANAIVNFSQRTDSPYLIGGLGIYNSKLGDFDSDNATGINIGGGLRFPLGQLGTFVEARYHTTLSDDQRGGRLQFIPITFGIVF